jgi:hypothetical protein
MWLGYWHAVWCAGGRTGFGVGQRDLFGIFIRSSLLYKGYT